MLNKDRQIWCMDIETIAGIFTYTAINIDTNETVQYVLHYKRDDLDALVNHLRTCKGHIGFNNIAFDYPVIHYLIENYLKWQYTLTTDEIVKLLYKKAQDVINAAKFDGFNNALIAEKDWKIPQLDLFKLWHFNNKARMTSLKSLQIAMNYPNVMDMPIHHSLENVSIKQINEVLTYNLNDVLSTFEFYKKSIDKIELRKGLNTKYDLNCLNYPDSKIGESLTLKLYCEATGKNPWEVKKLRTERLYYTLNKLIFPYIKFNSNTFNKFLTNLKSRTIHSTKGELEETVIYKGFAYDFGSGGIHGCISPNLYESDAQYMIIDCDVASLYPSIAILNALYPEHLGQEFCKVYEDGIVNPRLAAKKAGDMVMADGFKLSANSVYGKSNDKFSFLQDGNYTMKTTINGQLMLVMLCERLVDKLNDITILQVNTDGITVRIHRNNIAKYYNECNRWMDETKLTLEYVEYEKMWIRDVNNYGCLSIKGKIKNKGAFEVDKDYHKDNSFKIVPIAIQNYFVNNIPIHDTILGHTNIYDFCGRQKFKGEDYGTIHYLKDNEIVKEKQQKNTRYYISNKGATFIKNYAKGSDEVINKGYQVTIFNNYIEKDWKKYDLNYDFYIKETQKEIDNIINKQFKLEL